MSVIYQEEPRSNACGPRNSWSKTVSNSRPCGKEQARGDFSQAGGGVRGPIATSR